MSVTCMAATRRAVKALAMLTQKLEERHGKRVFNRAWQDEQRAVAQRARKPVSKENVAPRTAERAPVDAPVWH